MLGERNTIEKKLEMRRIKEKRTCCKVRGLRSLRRSARAEEEGAILSFVSLGEKKDETDEALSTVVSSDAPSSNSL